MRGAKGAPGSNGQNRPSWYTLPEGWRLTNKQLQKEITRISGQISVAVSVKNNMGLQMYTKVVIDTFRNLD